MVAERRKITRRVTSLFGPYFAFATISSPCKRTSCAEEKCAANMVHSISIVWYIIIRIIQESLTTLSHFSPLCIWRMLFMVVFAIALSAYNILYLDTFMLFGKVALTCFVRKAWWPDINTLGKATSCAKISSYWQSDSDAFWAWRRLNDEPSWAKHGFPGKGIHSRFHIRLSPRPGFCLP